MLLVAVVMGRDPPAPPLPDHRPPIPAAIAAPVPAVAFSERWRAATVWMMPARVIIRTERILPPPPQSSETMGQTKGQTGHPSPQQQQQEPDAVDAVDAPEPRPRPPARARTIRKASLDICARHGMRRVVVNGGKSWRCRRV